MRFLKQRAHIKYVIAKLSKFVKISMGISWDSFLQTIFRKLRGLESLQAKFFIKIFVILHKLAKLLTKFFSEFGFIFHASSFDDVMTFEYLKS